MPVHVYYVTRATAYASDSKSESVTVSFDARYRHDLAHPLGWYYRCP